MKSQGKQLLIIIICADLLILIAILVIRSLGSRTSSPDAVQPTTAANEAGPGIMVSGSVLNSDGMGVEGVTIYMSYASYPGNVIATTDALGNYQSIFYSIPGDEMITVWADKSGLLFQPENYYWRHYYGYEQRTSDFTAQSAIIKYLPMVNRTQK